MNKTQLAKMGLELAAELERLNPQYHVRSDEYNTIAWETDILQAKAKVLQEGSDPPTTLQDSVFVGRGALLASTAN